MAGRILGVASVKLGLSANPLFAGIGRVLTMLQGLGSAMGPIIPLAAGVGAALAGIGLAIAGAKLIGKGVGLAADFEQIATSLEVLLGSAEDASRLLQWLTNFAATTPFQFTGLADAARQLSAFGFGVDDIMVAMGPLGDLAAGTGSSLLELARIYGRVKTNGRASMEEIRLFTDRGIPLIDALGQIMGVATSEVRGLVEQGKIGFPEVTRAIALLTDEGGKFEGMMDRQSKTIRGLISTLKDNIEVPLRQIGESFIEAFNIHERISGLISFVQTVGPTIVGVLDSVFQAIGGFVDGVGTYLGMFGVSWLNAGTAAVTAISSMQVWFEFLGERVRLFGMKSALSFMDFAGWLKWAFIDVPTSVFVWFAMNWQKIFIDIWNFTATITTNLGKNLADFFMAVMSWLRGDGFDWKWTGLLDGFEATLTELPQIIDRQRGPTAKALQAIIDLTEGILTQDQKDRLQELLKERLPTLGEGEDTGPRASIASILSDGDKTGTKKAGASGTGFQALTEAWKTVQAAAFKDSSDPNNRTAKAAEKLADNSDTQKKDTASIAETVEAIKDAIGAGMLARLG